MLRMVKNLVLASSLLFASQAFSAQVSVSLTGTVSQEDREFLSGSIGVEFTEDLIALVKEGKEVTVEFEYNPDSDRRDPPECSVKIKETSSGSGGGSVNLGGKGRIGGEVGGGGSTTREYEIKGPCKEVRDIVNDIRRGGGKDQ